MEGKMENHTGVYRWRIHPLLIDCRTLSAHPNGAPTPEGCWSSLQLHKCVFFDQKVEYLGHMISPGCLQVAKRNTWAVEEATFPQTQTEIRFFIGFCNVYSRVIKAFAKIPAPLYSKIQKRNPISLITLKRMRDNRSRSWKVRWYPHQYWLYPSLFTSTPLTQIHPSLKLDVA